MTGGDGVFAEWAELYRLKGFWPRPITPRTKACHVPDWQKPDDEISPADLQKWLVAYESSGIGLLMGSPFPDGSTLGALDVDRDEYVRVAAALLRDPPCGRIGAKGTVFIIRVRGPLSNPEFRVSSDHDKRWGKVAECLFTKKLCVIPPTVHPGTGQPYRWVGTPLQEIDFINLPIIEMSDV